jgi:hypothetical protein
VRTLGQLIAAICAVLFVVSTVLVLLLLNIERKAFSSATYKQAFEDQHLYERMPAILANTLTTYMAESGISMPFLQFLTVEDWQNNIATLLPPEELKAMSNNALDATFDYLNGRSNSAVISLVPIKTQLAGEPGVQLVLQILRRQPACTAEQMTQMALGLFGGQIALCNPPEQAIGLMMPFIQSQLQTITALFPNEVTLISSAAPGTPQDPRVRLNAIRSGIKLTLFLPVLFLFGIAVFTVRSLRDLFAWWGWPLLFAGGISVIVALLGAPLIGGILRLVIQTQGSFFIPPALAAALGETASAVARQMLIPVIIQGLIITAVGVGMLAVAVLVPRRPVDQIIYK